MELQSKKNMLNPFDNVETIDINNDNDSDDVDEDNPMICMNIEEDGRSRETGRSIIAHRRRPEIEEPDSLENNVDGDEFDGRRVDLDELDVEEEDRRKNTFAAKKTVAQGMMDIALLTANANQLRYAIELKNTLVIGLIGFSLILQLLIGIAMIFKASMDYKGKTKEATSAKTSLDTYTIVGVFLITIFNIFIATFTTTTTENVQKKL